MRFVLPLYIHLASIGFLLLTTVSRHCLFAIANTMHSIAAALTCAVWMASATLGPSVNGTSSSRPSIAALTRVVFVASVALLLVVTGHLSAAFLSPIVATTTISLFALLSAPSQPILAPSQPLGLVFRIARFVVACVVLAYHVAVPNVGSSVFATRLDRLVSKDAEYQDAHSRWIKLGARYVESLSLVNKLNRKIQDIGRASVKLACSYHNASIFGFRRCYRSPPFEFPEVVWEEPSLFTKMCKYSSHFCHPLPPCPSSPSTMLAIPFQLPDTFPWPSFPSISVFDLPQSNPLHLTLVDHLLSTASYHSLFPHRID